MNFTPRRITVLLLAAIVIAIVAACLCLRLWTNHLQVAGDDWDRLEEHPTSVIGDKDLSLVSQVVKIANIGGADVVRIWMELDEPDVTVNVRVDASASALQQCVTSNWCQTHSIVPASLRETNVLPEFMKLSWWDVFPLASKDLVYCQPLTNEEGVYRVAVIRARGQHGALYYVLQTTTKNLPPGFVPMMQSHPGRPSFMPSQGGLYSASWRITPSTTRPSDSRIAPG